MKKIFLASFIVIMMGSFFLGKNNRANLEYLSSDNIEALTTTDVVIGFHSNFYPDMGIVFNFVVCREEIDDEMICTAHDPLDCLHSLDVKGSPWEIPLWPDEDWETTATWNRVV